MTTTQARASKKQLELLRFVDGFIKGSGYGPSYREIMRSLGYKSVSTVAIHVDNLIAKGYLRRTDNTARSLEVVTLDIDKQPQKMTEWQIELGNFIKARSLSDDKQKTVDEALTILGLNRITKDTDA